MSKLLNTVSLIGLFALCFIGGCYGWKAFRAERKEVKSIAHNIAVAADTVVYYIDRDSVEHARKEVEVMDLRAANILHAKDLAAITRKLNIARKQIAGYESAIAELRGQVNTPLVPVRVPDTSGGRDTFYLAKAFNWKDEYFEVSGLIDSADIHLTYAATIPVHLTTFWQRKHKWFGIRWGKKVYHIDGYSDNKNVHLTGLSEVKIN